MLDIIAVMVAIALALWIVFSIIVAATLALETVLGREIL